MPKRVRHHLGLVPYQEETRMQIATPQVAELKMRLHEKRCMRKLYVIGRRVRVGVHRFSPLG